ncbi:MAG: alpha/beta hydrolase [Pseudomonadota bacterium]
MPSFTAADGRRLHYLDEGEGPPVLCLAGLSRNHRDFDPLAAHLRGRFRVLRLDGRGRGRSDHAEHPLQEYSPQVEAGDALGLLAHLGLTGVGLVGTSRGGVLGMMMAAGRPGSVAALALNDVGAELELPGLLRILAYLGRPPTALSFAEAAERLARDNAAQFPNVGLARWEAHARAIYDDDAGRPVLSYDPHLSAATGAALDMEMPHVDLWPLFEAVKAIPVLVIRGANSDILSAETLARMAREHPGLAQVTIADRGHAPFLDEPEALAALDAFLTEHLPP